MERQWLYFSAPPIWKPCALSFWKEETPAAIVYKATWPDEKVVHGTVGILPEMAAKNGITKTALILIGNFLGKAYERSKLYAPDFSHGYRTAQKKGPSNAD